jgi:hypothetical protein
VLYLEKFVSDMIKTEVMLKLVGFQVDLILREVIYQGKIIGINQAQVRLPGDQRKLI